MRYFLLKTTVVLFVLLVVIISCSEEKKQDKTELIRIESEINPNGDSELALLMREMYNEAERIKQDIASGKPATLEIDHEAILTAQATEPERAETPEFKGMATGYLQTVSQFETTSSSDQVKIYDNLVTSCISCHEVMCPGPIKKIRKLR